MPVKVKIGRKDPSFKGGPVTYNVSVFGPEGDFTTGLRRTLELNGITPFKNDDGILIWSAPYSMGGAKFYLGHLLAAKYGAIMQPDTHKDAMDVVSERLPLDGIDHILGSMGAMPPGRMKLSIIAAREDFVANCNADDKPRREFLEAAGWLPVKKVSPALADKVGTQPYRMRDPFIAGNLEPFMSQKAKKLLNEKYKTAGKAIKYSRSHTGEDAPGVAAPEGLSFFPFQLQGIAMAVNSPGGSIIADDMGLGKTMQAIGLINASPWATKILIISQANMRLKWGMEIEKWKVRPDLTVGVAESSNFPDTDVAVINYDILMKNWDALHTQDWDLIICDEAHNLKNHEAQRTQAVLGDLLEKNGAVGLTTTAEGKMIHLTGTPKPNRIEELWPLISSTRPDLWGSGPVDRQIFLNRYCPPHLIQKEMPSKRPGGKPYKMIVPLPGKPIREAELQLRLRGSGSFMRRMKRDNPDLPPKFRTPLQVPVKLSRDELESLRSVEFDLNEMLAKTRKGGDVVEGRTALAGAVIDQITKILPDSPQFHEMARVRRNVGMIKAPHCAKFILDELEAENDFAPENQTKTVVFAHHKDVIAIIKAEADKRMKGTCLVYDGSVGSAKKKQDLVDRFQTDPKIRCMIISLAGNSGITLTQSARMRVVEPDWSPSNMVQIEDRIWRIGQEKNVDIGYMSMAGTLDARIGMAIAAKMETDEKSINTISFLHSKDTSKASNDQNLAAEDLPPAIMEQETGSQAALPLFEQ